jgi:hypothetical protein
MIELSSGERADVRWGTVVKKQLNPFFFWRAGKEKKKGYIVRVGAAAPREYRFLRTLDGDWISEGDGGFQPTPDDALGLELKEAIGRYENEH